MAILLETLRLIILEDIIGLEPKKLGNLHNGTSPLTVQLQYGTPNRKIMYTYAPILRLYRFVAEPHNGTGVIKKIMYTYPRVN